MSAIEAVYIFDEHNTLLIDHVYTGDPPSPSNLILSYLQEATPRPSLVYFSTFTPPTLCYSIIQDNILFLSPVSTTSSAEPLLVLEFLHRVSEALQEFLGTPLLATKITSAYDIVAQILSEIADGGVISQSEANALRDVVETGPGVLKNLLGSIGASGTSPALTGTAGGGGSLSAGSSLGNTLRPQISQTQSNQGSAIPWRRSNVRHTSNELYVDIVESLSVTLAPSGRPLAAFAHGSIVFNCKVSGVPDLLLNLSTGGHGSGMGTKGEQLQRVMERAVFHPCVRLNRWKGEGVLSFIPPDGRFALCGYEVDLLGDATLSATSNSALLNLPATINIAANLGSSGSEFEVRITSQLQPGRSPAAASLQSHLSLSSNRSRPIASSSDTTKSTAPPLEDLTVHVPLPAERIRNISDLRPSKGEAHWNPAEGMVEWKVPAKEFGNGSAVLRCTIQGLLSDEDESLTGRAVGGILNGSTTATTTYDYDHEYNEDNVSSYQSHSQKHTLDTHATTFANGASPAADAQQQQTLSKQKNKDLMPTTALLSFTLKGSLPSGIRVESLLVDTKKSRGLGVEIKPYKGVKYLTVSEKGVEVRC